MNSKSKILNSYSKPKYAVRIGELHGVMIIDYTEDEKYEKNIDLTLFKDEDFIVTFYAKMNFNNDYTAVESKFGYFDESNTKAKREVRNTPFYESADKLNSFMPIKTELFIDLVKDILINKYNIHNEFEYYQVIENEIKKYYNQDKNEEDLIGYNAFNQYFYVCVSIFNCISKKTKKLIIDDYNFHEFPEIILSCDWITELELYELLIAEIPEELTRLKALRKLSLKLKFLTELPATLQRLSGLEEFKLDGSSLHELSDNLFELTSLKELQIINNKEIENISDKISRLRNLEYLYLYSNEIKELTKTIFRLENLEILDLSNNKIEKIPNELTALPRLKRLNLKGNKLKNIPSDLFEMTWLEEVNLSKNTELNADEVYNLLMRSGRSDEINLIL